MLFQREKQTTNKLHDINVRKNNLQTGFTIVEMLITIVIIGILASITIIAYIGISARADISSIQSDLANAAIRLEMKKAESGSYPTSLEEAESNGLKHSPDTVFSYNFNSDSNGYCLSATKRSITYHITADNRTPAEGECAVYSSFAINLSSTDYGIKLDLALTSDDEALLVGSAFKDGNRNALITKLNTNNNVSWSKSLNLSSISSASSATQSNDGYIIAGSSGNDLLLAKLDTSGSLKWSKTWGSGGAKLFSNQIIKTSDGGYALAGFITITSYDNCGESKTNNSDKEIAYNPTSLRDGGNLIAGQACGVDIRNSFVAKINHDGEIIWSKAWNDSRFNDRYNNANSIVQTDSGDYIVVGDNGNFVAITRISSDGGIDWYKTWDDGLPNSAKKIIKSNDGNYVITGDYTSASFDRNILIAKINPSGDTVWAKELDDEYNNNDYANSVIQANDNSFTVVGVTNECKQSVSYIKKDLAYEPISIVDGGGEMALTSLNNCGGNAFLANLTADGNLRWSKTWAGNGRYSTYSIAQSSDNGYVVSVSDIEDQKISLNKFTATGEISNCPASLCNSIQINEASLSRMSSVYTPETINIPGETTTRSPEILDVQIAITNRIIPSPSITPLTNKELFVEWPGDDQSTCKEWTAPFGKAIVGFHVSQETEEGYDYFKVYANGSEVYNFSGHINNAFTDISSNPANKLKACISTDESYQDGYGGEVIDVIYN